MRKALKILLTMTVVGSLFAVGFAGNAAALADDNQVQVSGQYASSDVSQTQYVAQGNANSQEDNYAVSAAGSIGGDAESDDATAIQASYQSNENAQVAWSNAQNFNWQNQDD
ncbi:hypothetical protein ZOD2009_11030 [Haladaptatus paucihalophilus DX253]|uniref:Uncharacterized protein n=1 Tax=Haladaptatus paucihalophilus DX253 TaxID=797209 RepID=E7QTS8_HALPU|nr:hypothetical protein [Haladaptatus paucihalophilus]EFW92007.1 hypothetical protein ZOD2009_11030 [Haladaptatus paucihalophilus DX253]SHK85602.1 hypothetical protein SAMN05444342_2410 [Haladaptatus paucihalophilus DX253]